MFMKLVRILMRNIRDSFKSIVRNFSLSFASISCITITLIVVTIAMILSENVHEMTKKIEADVTIVAFLNVDVTQERIEEIGNEIRALPNIQPGSQGLQLDDKEKLRQDMMEASDTYKDILKNWENREDNHLKDAYRIKVVDIEKSKETADAIRNIEGVEVVQDSEEMIHQLISVFDVITKGTYIIVIALILVTAFLITNTIKITIFSRKREIDIMRLVGASNMNIKIPFIFEGLLLGILGSVIPIIITIYGYSTIYTSFKGKVFGNIIQLVEPQPFVYYVSLVLMGIGIIVGMFGSWRAVRKHLKI